MHSLARNSSLGLGAAGSASDLLQAGQARDEPGLPLVSKAADATDDALHLGESVAGWLAEHLGAAAPAAAGAAGATVVLGLVIRVLVVRRSLRRRVRWAVLPTDEFDPSAESVLLFARQLQRVRRRRGDWLARPAVAVRAELRSVGRGGMLYGLAAPRRARALIRASALPGTELHDPATLDLGALDLGAMVENAPAAETLEAGADERRGGVEALT